MKDSRFACPKCGTIRTQRCEVAYEQSRTVGERYDSQRPFAGRVAPPSLPTLWRPGLLALAGFIVLAKAGAFSDVVFGLVLVALALGMYVRRSAKVPAYEEELALYPKLWVCHDCGKIFQPE